MLGNCSFGLHITELHASWKLQLFIEPPSIRAPSRYFSTNSVCLPLSRAHSLQAVLVFCGFWKYFLLSLDGEVSFSKILDHALHYYKKLNFNYVA